MNDALRAHLRLLETTPQERITTHYCTDEYVERQQGHRIGDLPEDLVQEVRALHIEGKTQTTICAQLRLGCRTYDRIRRLLMQRQTPEERRAMVESMLERGVSLRSCSSATGLSRTTIIKYKRRLRAA